MSKNKRRWNHSLSILLILCTLTSAVSAAVQPRYASITRFSATISVSSSGFAECYSKVNLANSVYTSDLTLELQRSSNGSSWDPIKTWSASGSGTVTLDKSRYVDQGYYYRVFATAKVKTSSGTVVEAATTYSTTVWY